MVRSARQVEVSRLHGIANLELISKNEGAVPRLRDLHAKASRAVGDPGFLSHLSRFLLDDASWRPSRYGAEIAYGSDVGVRFEKEGQTLELFLCVNCAGLVMVSWAGEAWVFETDSSRALLDLALEVFPDDRPFLWWRALRVAPQTPSELLGPAAAILADPAAAEALVVRSPPHATREIAELEVEAAHPVDSALLARLARALGRPETYLFGPGKRCIFVPNVAFRIRKGRETAEVILCFGCSQMRANVLDADGRPAHTAAADFDGGELWEIASAAVGGEAELKRLLKAARPDQ